MAITKLDLTKAVSVTLPDGNAPSESIVQVVSGTSSTAFTQGDPASGTVYYPSSNKLTVSITPSSTSSKILVYYESTIKVTNNNAVSDIGMSIAAKEIIGATTNTIHPSTHAFSSGFYLSTFSASQVIRQRQNHMVLRSPATTSEITYEVGMFAYGVTINTGEVALNADGSEGRIFAMEILG